MTEVTLDAAYEEACRALGEATVMQRLIAQRLKLLEAEVQRLTPTPPDRKSDEPSYNGIPNAEPLANGNGS